MKYKLAEDKRQRVGEIFHITLQLSEKYQTVFFGAKIDPVGDADSGRVIGGKSNSLPRICVGA